ncbi:MAG: alpha/beta fold hydrolase [Anaerolineae bacterium]
MLVARRPRFRKNDYDVIMIDARGHGQSQRGAIFAISAMADDTAAVIRSLKLDKPFLFGHSMARWSPCLPLLHILILRVPYCLKIRRCSPRS